MNYAAFASYIVLSAYTPGPNNIMAMTNASRLGLRRALRFCAGALLGFFLDMSLCAVFTSLLYQAIPTVEPVMRWVGAIYILFLAWTVFRDKPHDARKRRLRPDSFLTGMVMQFVNVKVILYGITALSTFVLPYHQSFGALALAVLVLTVNGSSANVCWALFGSVFQKLFNSHRRAVNTVMSLLLVYCAISSLVG